jgi:hypothetical protein
MGRPWSISSQCSQNQQTHNDAAWLSLNLTLSHSNYGKNQSGKRKAADNGNQKVVKTMSGILGMRIAAMRNLLLVGAAAVFLLACQSLMVSYQGATVHSEERIPLVAGALQAGGYLAPDLAVYYQYVWNQSELDISGVVVFAGSISGNFTSIKKFHLSVVLLGAEGRIVGNKLLQATSFSDPSDPMPFSERIALPPGVSGMAFVYGGDAREGGQDGVATTFWHYPITK